jgi:2-oxoglutarate dehydrogenase E2 component (dihydrolipoamide succinyltransferase)
MQEKKNTVNRRDFLRLSGLATAGVVVTACGAQPAQPAPQEEAPAEAPQEEAAPAEEEAEAAAEEAPAEEAEASSGELMDIPR